MTRRKEGAVAHSPAVMIPVEGTGTTVMFCVVCRWLPSALMATPPPAELTPPPSCLGTRRTAGPVSTEPGMASTAVG